jgi:hypothetical protein
MNTPDVEIDWTQRRDETGYRIQLQWGWTGLGWARVDELGWELKANDSSSIEAGWSREQNRATGNGVTDIDIDVARRVIMSCCESRSMQE